MQKIKTDWPPVDRDTALLLINSVFSRNQPGYEITEELRTFETMSHHSKKIMHQILKENNIPGQTAIEYLVNLSFEKIPFGIFSVTDVIDEKTLINLKHENKLQPFEYFNVNEVSRIYGAIFNTLLAVGISGMHETADMMRHQDSERLIKKIDEIKENPNKTAFSLGSDNLKIVN